MQTDESTVTIRTAPNPLGAYLNAKYRDQEAFDLHRDFFESDQHEQRIDKVCDLLEAFFKRTVDYITARGVNRTIPFDNVKMADVGRKLSAESMQDKWDKLYGPLKELGDVDVISHNGHLLVRVYPVGKMPKKLSKNSVYKWY